MHDLKVSSLCRIRELLEYFSLKRDGSLCVPAQYLLGQILRRVLFDPDPNAGADRSLRAYIHAASSGLADLEAVVGLDPMFALRSPERRCVPQSDG